MDMTGLARSTIQRLKTQGRFPKPIHPLGHIRVAAWRLSDVQAWVDARAAGKAA